MNCVKIISRFVYVAIFVTVLRKIAGKLLCKPALLPGDTVVRAILPKHDSLKNCMFAIYIPEKDNVRLSVDRKEWFILRTDTIEHLANLARVRNLVCHSCDEFHIVNQANMPEKVKEKYLLPLKVHVSRDYSHRKRIRDAAYTINWMARHG